MQGKQPEYLKQLNCEIKNSNDKEIMVANIVNWTETQWRKTSGHMCKGI